MTQRTFQQQLDTVYLWMDICDYHWDRLLGDIYNDQEFWNDLFHAMEAQDWQDLIQVAKAIKIAHPQELRRFPNYDYNIEVIEKRLHKLDKVIKPFNRQNYNKQPMSLFMSVRDALNEVNGKPTKRWTDEERKKIQEDRNNQFQRLFDIK